MQQGITVFEAKGQARRLRTAMLESFPAISHGVALNLIARVHGARNWESLEAQLGHQEVQPTAPTTTDIAAFVATLEGAPGGDEQWLKWLEASLRMQDVEDSDLDEWVHRVVGDDEGEQVNNDGMGRQLTVLLSAHPTRDEANARRRLLERLEADLDTQVVLPLPEMNRPGRESIRMRVSICVGSQFEEESVFDALEYFANASPDTISGLIEDGLHNTSSSDEVALWLEKNSIDVEAKQHLTELLGRMRSICDGWSNEDVVGVTVDVDEGQVARFLTSQPGYSVRYSKPALAALGLVALN